MQLGALSARVASFEELTHITTWTIPFGYEFQLRDDLLDITTSHGKKDKDYFGDIRESKRTLLLSYALHHCSLKQQNILTATYLKSKTEKTEAKIIYVANLFKQCGAVTYIHNKIQAYTNQAIRLFIKNTRYLPNSQAKETIKSAIWFAANREH